MLCHWKTDREALHTFRTPWLRPTVHLYQLRVSVRSRFILLQMDITQFILLTQMETLSHTDPTVATRQYNVNLSAGALLMSTLEATTQDLHTPQTVPLMSLVVQEGVIEPTHKDGPQTGMNSMGHISSCLVLLWTVLHSRIEISPTCLPTWSFRNRISFLTESMTAYHNVRSTSWQSMNSLSQSIRRWDLCKGQKIGNGPSGYTYSSVLPPNAGFPLDFFIMARSNSLSLY